MTIQTLVNAGNKVTVHHSRYYQEKDGLFLTRCGVLKEKKKKGIYDPRNVCCRGGLTEVEVKLLDGTILRGRAECSQKDNFDRKKGVKIALGRALVNGEK